MPVFRTRISTSLMPISGSGTSSSHKPGSALALTSARNSSSSSRRPRPQQARRIFERLSQAPSPSGRRRGMITCMGDNPFSLAGRVAVVTGGTGAIGSALATGLAQAGARVVVLARSADGVERTVAGARGGRPRDARDLRRCPRRGGARDRPRCDPGALRQHRRARQLRRRQRRRGRRAGRHLTVRRADRGLSRRDRPEPRRDAAPDPGVRPRDARLGRLLDRQRVVARGRSRADPRRRLRRGQGGRREHHALARCRARPPRHRDPGQRDRTRDS